MARAVDVPRPLEVVLHDASAPLGYPMAGGLGLYGVAPLSRRTPGGDERPRARR